MDNFIVTKYENILNNLLDKNVEFLDSVNKPINLDYIKDSVGTSIFLKDKESKETIAYFTLSQLVGCCGVCVSSQARVCENWQNKKIGSLLHEMRIEIAKFSGYTVMLCTDVLKNEKQRHILKKYNWKDLFVFKNKRTNNEVAISLLEL